MLADRAAALSQEDFHQDLKPRLGLARAGQLRNFEDCARQPPAIANHPTAERYAMIRPCFLVVDQEHAGSISTRKLVIETAKFNVITAYSGEEALETLAKFPAVDGVVLDAGVKDVSCADLVKRIKTSRPNLPVIMAGTLGYGYCDGADHYLETFDPGKLLKLLQHLQPEKTAQILRIDEKLTRPDS
jgi:CheY-like chemotaxis protein